MMFITPYMLDPKLLIPSTEPILEIYTIFIFIEMV